MSFRLLRQISYTSGGDIAELLDANLRARSGTDINYLHGILMEISFSIASASTSDAIAQDQFTAVLPQIQFWDQNDEPYFDRDMTGGSLHLLSQLMLRRGPVQPAAISANSDTTNTPTLLIYVPYYLPRLAEPWAFLEPSAMLKRITAKWAASSVFGTGQVVGSSTTLRIYSHDEPMDKLEHGPRLYYGKHGLNSFTDFRLPLRGRVLTVAVADHDSSATTSIGATDFTDFEFEGNDLRVSRERINVPTHLYNVASGLAGDAHDAALALPTSGSARMMPLYTYAPGAKISNLPHEQEPAVRLIVGAGAPALTDQEYIYAVARPYGEDLFAQAIGRAKDINVDAQQVKAMIAHAQPPAGRKGTIGVNHPMAPYLRRALTVEAAPGCGGNCK